MENDLSLKIKQTVTSADTDMFGRLRLSSFFNFFIQSAILSADKLGFGWSGLRENNLFWVLSRFVLEIERVPQWKEEVEIETWPKTVDKIMYIRDFIARDSSGKSIAKATSGWFAIDLQTKRPKVIDIIHDDVREQMSRKHAIVELPHKIMQKETDSAIDISTTYFDYDLNGHVTSTRYVDRMMDSINLEYHKDNYPKKLIMNYLNETLPGDNIRLLFQNGDEEKYFEGVNLRSEMPAFRGIIQF